MKTTTGIPFKLSRSNNLTILWPETDRDKLYVYSSNDIHEVRSRETGTVISYFIRLFSNTYAELFFN